MSISGRFHLSLPRNPSGKQLFQRRALHTISLALLLLSATGRMGAQVSPPDSHQGAPTNPQLSFDVVSVRENAPTPPYSQYVSNPPHNGIFDATDIWMTQVIAWAYDVNFRTQLFGGPEWIGHQRFTIHARSSPEVDSLLAAKTDGEANEAKRAMLRAILAERFGLKAHFETRAAVVYTLTFAKPSPHLKESAPGVLSDDQLSIRSSGDAHHIELIAHQVSMETLVSNLGFYLQNEVFDRTGLTKLYDFNVAFDPHPDPQTDSPNAAPPAEVAFPEQLGLKLMRGTAPIKTLIVDALTMPTPN